jgi:DNA-binding NtrC family response regulator
MDGQATMTALEKLDPKVRIIASSGLRGSGRVAEAIAAGQGAFLPKPYTDEQMLATLAKVLQPSSMNR